MSGTIRTTLVLLAGLNVGAAEWGCDAESARAADGIQSDLGLRLTVDERHRLEDRLRVLCERAAETDKDRNVYRTAPSTHRTEREPGLDPNVWVELAPTRRRAHPDEWGSDSGEKRHGDQK